MCSRQGGTNKTRQPHVSCTCVAIIGPSERTISASIRRHAKESRPAQKPVMSAVSLSALRGHISETKIHWRIKAILWGKAGGRCEYCNNPLWLDPLLKSEFNTGYIAHIIADKADGPRGDPVLSPKLRCAPSNLMLLCDTCHKRIDVWEVEAHSVERLRLMKREHESRIETLTGITPEKQAHMLLYGANIGAHSVQVNWNLCAQAMIPDWYPAEPHALEMSLKNSAYQDHEKDYWEIELENLRRQFDRVLRPRLHDGTVKHLAVFALAPQPLLIELGHLLSDVCAADVYQLHREPPTWAWQPAPSSFGYRVIEPAGCGEHVALNLSLSASIDPSRITKVLGTDVAIWTVTIDNPNNDFIKSREQVSQFRREFRGVLNHIKAIHGEETLLHLFPATPVSIAVEIGRVWMPKADLPIRVYEQNRTLGGFHYVFDIPDARGDAGGAG